MRSMFLAIIALLLAGCVTTPDPIDRLVSSLAVTEGRWENGMYIPVQLPSTASAEDVISKVLQGEFASYKILKIRQVHIPCGGRSSEAYTAALVQTASGEKIVLIKYEAGGWWNRIYDAKTSA